MDRGLLVSCLYAGPVGEGWVCQVHGSMANKGSDVYGHSNGFVKWCGGNRILMGNHRDLYPREGEEIIAKLEENGFIVTEMRFKNEVPEPNWDLNWAYINFLQVGKNIIMPSFGIDEKDIAH